MASARDVDVEAITVRLNECSDPDGWQEAFQRTRYLVLTYPFMGNVKECTSLASEITEHSRFDKDSHGLYEVEVSFLALRLQILLSHPPGFLIVSDSLNSVKNVDRNRSNT